MRFESLEPRELMAFDPSPAEQELMQLTNRFRTDPKGEFNRLMSSASPAVARDKNVDDAIKFFNVSGTTLQSELAALNPIQPLVWEDGLMRMGRDYTQLMIAQNSQSHTLQGSLQSRFANYGYNGSNITAAAENLYKNAFSPIHAHASYVIDWGTGTGGMQSPRGHRDNLTRSDFNAAGIALASTTYDSVKQLGPLVSAEDFVRLTTTGAMFTGAVFEDKNGSSWYDAGEGISGVTITLIGSAGTFSAGAMTAGGYQLAVPAGTYTATASGANLRFPVSVSNVQIVSGQNTWLNFVYTPSSVPPDALEPNNSTTAATLLTGSDQTLSNLTVPAGDVDYFKLTSQSAGTLRVDLRFSNAQGNLDLRLLDSAGSTLARSNGTSDLETIQFAIQFGAVYYAVVERAAAEAGGPYSLQIDVPASQPPTARNDGLTAIAGGSSVTVDVLANDIDPDGAIGSATVTIATQGRGSASVVANKIVYQPPTGFAGIDRVQYKVTDTTGLSAFAFVEAMILDLTRPLAYQNPVNALDTNGDNSVSPIDALLVINEINARAPRLLPLTPAEAIKLFGFVDVNGDKVVSAIDALLVINRLNGGTGEGEGLSPIGIDSGVANSASIRLAATDAALLASYASIPRRILRMCRLIRFA
ncbi:MAG: dockerin type I domain-containing protein [Pirellulales bacterium]